MDRFAGKFDFVQKQPKKRPFWGATNRTLLTLGGAGGQTVETRSTFGVRLKSLGYNASNGLYGKLYLLFKSFLTYLSCLTEQK